MSRNIAIICNPLSGKGKPLKLLPDFEAYVQKQGVSYVVFTYDLPANLHGFTDVVVMGGDGTLNYALNHFGQIPIPLGYISCGTGNDIGRLLLNGKSFEQQFETAVHAEIHKVDCGTCNNRLFLNGAGIGFDGRVTRRLLAKTIWSGQAAYYSTVIPLLFFYREHMVRITADGNTWQTPLFMLNAANGKTYGGGFRVAPYAEPDDGLLEVVTISRISLWQRFTTLPVMERGKHLDRSFSFITYQRLKKVVIESPRLLDAHLDGEHMQASRFEIEVLPAFLSIRY